MRPAPQSYSPPSLSFLQGTGNKLLCHGSNASQRFRREACDVQTALQLWALPLDVIGRDATFGRIRNVRRGLQAQGEEEGAGGAVGAAAAEGGVAGDPLAPGAATTPQCRLLLQVLNEITDADQSLSIHCMKT